MSRFARNFARLAALAAVTTLAACSGESPVAPEMQVQRTDGLVSDLVTGLVNGLVPVKALTRTSAVAAPITRSVKFTKAVGGLIEIPETGFRLEVPANAIPRDTMTITVTALPGKSVAYEFQPHGTLFAKPLVFRQSLVATTWFGSLLKPTLSGGYFKDKAQLDLPGGISLLNEILPLSILGNEARFNINHFSGYMVSSGRASYASDEF